MPGKTSIEWATCSWNFITGCDEVSTGCNNCYAKTLAERFRGSKAFPHGFDVTLHPERIRWPFTQKKPQMIFVNSMSDLFHKDISDEYILSGFDTMLVANHHIYQVLTKRPSRLANTELTEKILRLAVLRTGKKEWPKRIWLGTSVENQDYVWRVDKLRQVPAPIRFISAEPLLGPIDFDLQGISWLITGSESGRGARPMDDDWVRNLRDQAIQAETAFFFKQRTVRGKKVGLPELDGKVWNEFPNLESRETHEVNS